jgi:hypothetical protein
MHPSETPPAHHTALRKRRPPPYARRILALRAQGVIPSEVVVFVGDLAWCRKPQKNKLCLKPTIILPPSENPADFAWPVAGSDVLVFQQGAAPERIFLELARECLMAGARVVCVVQETGETAFYRPGKGRRDAVA